MIRPTRAAVRLSFFLGLAGLLHAPDLFAIGFTGEAPPPDHALTLWYRRPADQWTEALPVGNGRLGAMVFGGVTNERLQLNEDTLWAGGPYDPVNPGARAALPRVRQLVFQGRYKEADQLLSADVMARPLKQMPYQTVGDLLITFREAASVEGYRRELDLDTAVARTRYTLDGTRFLREVFVSPVHQVLVVRLTADRPGQIGFTATLVTPQQATVTAPERDTLLLSGVNTAYEGIPGALRFQARLRVLPEGGQVSTVGATVSVQRANAVTILMAAATSYRRHDDVSGDPAALVAAALETAAQRSFGERGAVGKPRGLSAFRGCE